MADYHEITVLINRLKSGDQKVAEELMPLVYNELYQIAHQKRLQWHAGQTLNTTALVHEAFIKVKRHSDISWEDRNHFLAVASKTMRSILVDHARKQQALKRGGKNYSELELDEHLLCAPNKAEDILALESALNYLEERNERCCRIVEHRFFGGLSIEETAGVLNISTATVKRDWRFAKNWLYKEINQLMTTE